MWSDRRTTGGKGEAVPPNDTMDVSAQGLALITEFEGFSATLYNDPGPGKHATIGFGHKVHDGPIDGSEPEEFKRGITRERGLELLREDAVRFVAAVRKFVTVPLNQNEFDALVSFTYNVGPGKLRDSSLRTKLNAGDRAGAADELLRYTKSKGVELPGLVRRRKAERALFLKPAGAPRPADDGEDDEMARFVKATGQDAIYLTNGIHRRWISSRAKMVELTTKLGVPDQVVVISADSLDDLILVGPEPDRP